MPPIRSNRVRQMAAVASALGLVLRSCTEGVTIMA